MAECKYNRRNHLIGLILAVIVYILLNVIYIIHSSVFYYFSWLIFLIIYIVLWWLRGLPSLAKWFPLFHYITLIFEFISHCLSLLSAIYWSITLVLALFRNFNLWTLLLALGFIFALVVYILLVYVLVVVPYVLLKGSMEQKAELAKDVVSGDAINLPGGVAIPQQQA